MEMADVLEWIGLFGGACILLIGLCGLITLTTWCIYRTIERVLDARDLRRDFHQFMMDKAWKQHHK